MTAPITDVSSKKSLPITHGKRSRSKEWEPKGRSSMEGERASSSQSYEQLIDSSQSTIRTTFTDGRHFSYDFCQNAIRILYPQLDLSKLPSHELPNPEMDIDDALMQLHEKRGNTYIFFEFIIFNRARCVEDLDDGVIFEVDKV